VLGRLRQEDLEFKISLDNTTNFCVKNKNKITTKKRASLCFI
jgi:hypothetical protein